jgi:hypothetical protein
VGDFNLVIKMARCESGKDKDCTGEATHTVQNEETEMRCCGPCADHAPGNATVETISKAFTIGWSIVKSDFNPDDDTCEACGGQKTPEHPYYAPDGPKNGNCAKELPGCR